MNSNYDFREIFTNSKSVIHAINMHGDNLIGAEIGVWQAENLCVMADNCYSIKHIYGIDNWLPHTQCDGRVVDQKQIEMQKFIAYHNVNWCNSKEKITLIDSNSQAAADQFDDGYFDFIFLDIAETYDQAIYHMNIWDSKVKDGGLIIGHDWYQEPIRNAVLEFYNNKKISSYDNTWVLKK